MAKPKPATQAIHQLAAVLRFDGLNQLVKQSILAGHSVDQFAEAVALHLARPVPPPPPPTPSLSTCWSRATP